MKKIIRLTESDLARIVKRVMLQEAVAIYVVQPGDNLTKIAKMNNITVGDILKMNPQIKNANKIYPGDEIKIVDTPPVTPDMPRSRVDTSPVTPDMLMSRNVGDCYDMLKRKPNDGSVGGSPYESLEISGDVELSYNATVAPNSRAVTVIKNGKPFCKIPVMNGIGDCRDEMTLDSDMPGSDMKASLDSPVSINITGTVSPNDRGLIIKDAGGYFCKVPTGLSESRMRRRRF